MAYFKLFSCLLTSVLFLRGMNLSFCLCSELFLLYIWLYLCDLGGWLSKSWLLKELTQWASNMYNIIGRILFRCVNYWWMQCWGFLKNHHSPFFFVFPVLVGMCACIWCLINNVWILQEEPSPTTGSFLTPQWMYCSGMWPGLFSAANGSNSNPFDERKTKWFEFKPRTRSDA